MKSGREKRRGKETSSLRSTGCGPDQARGKGTCILRETREKKEHGNFMSWRKVRSLCPPYEPKTLTQMIVFNDGNIKGSWR